MRSAERPEFTVDTGLFRQLGELLVGRDSTALVELIKNAYDADSTMVLLRGENLDDPSHAILEVADDGIGMTEQQFREGFLRVAARGKASGERRSPLYRRRYTGEKGVGRLAAHKLAAVVDVNTVAAVTADALPLVGLLRDGSPAAQPDDLIAKMRRAQKMLLLAQLDWDEIERFPTLSDVAQGLTLATDDAGRRAATGTTLTLTRLRHAWSTIDLRDLVRQLHNFEPPKAIVSRLPRTVVPQQLLFTEPTVRDADRADPGLTLELEGDFRDPDEFWGSVLARAEWVLEIRAAAGRDVQFSVSPTRAGVEANPHCEAITASMQHPDPGRGPFFDARVLLRPGQVPSIETGWAEYNSGVRVYLEGFRVLPYGEPRNDWLSLDADYTKRAGRFQIDPLVAGSTDDLSRLRELSTRDVSLRLLPNRAFFGAVFLTEGGLGGLRTLVNREGFVPDESYERLVAIVSVGVRLLLRARALASRTLAREEDERRRAEEEARRAKEEPHQVGESDAQSSEAGDERTEPTDGGEEEPPTDSKEDEQLGDEWSVLGTDGSTRGSAARVYEELAGLRFVLGLPPRNESVDGHQDAVVEAVASVERAVDLLVEDASLLRVLASVGAQLAAFTHEVAHLVPSAAAAESALAPIRGRRWPPEAVQARRAVAEIRRALERQASYLVDVASTEGRRRRSRQRVTALVDVAFLGFQGSAAARDVELINRVPEAVRTPPLFRAELQAILTNLLSNAIKAAGSPGRVEVAAEQEGDTVRIVVQNTGVAVTPDEAEGWFRPYASTTAEMDPVLGQGMGLGLPITRDLVAEYGGTVRFIGPGEGYATAVEVVIPE